MPTVSIDHKLQAAKELAQYLQPKLRAIDLTHEVGESVTHLAQRLQAAHQAAAERRAHVRE
jgi:hypothetical protein